MAAGCGGSGEPSCPEGVGCSATDECETGLVCHFGTCQQPLPDGAICTLSTQCAGAICNLGQCTSELLGNGEACTTDAACASGVCLGFCVVPDCGNGTCNPLAEICGTSTPGGQLPCAADCGKCPLNHVCAANVDCTSGFCDLDFWGGSPDSACRPCEEANAGLCPNGASCDDDVDCQGTSICQSGYCAPPPPPCSGSNRPDGCQCTSNSQCSSNLCASIPSHPDVCAPASCAGKLPGSACLKNSDCCDFPGVNINCSWFICQP